VLIKNIFFFETKLFKLDDIQETALTESIAVGKVRTEDQIQNEFWTLSKGLLFFELSWP